MTAYTMARFGQNRIHVLDGGLDKWTAENRAVTQELPKVKEGAFKCAVRDECHVDIDQLKKLGMTPDKTIITYCGAGREATNLFLLFRCYLGYPNVKLYEGSFTEWVADSNNPIVTGPNPR